MFILVKFGGPAIGKALAARHQQLKADLAAAAAARAEAEARLAQQEARLAALEQEIEAIRTGRQGGGGGREGAPHRHGRGARQADQARRRPSCSSSR